jgi:YD repeat-containing protein
MSAISTTLTNVKGKLIKVESSVSTTECTAFDILGRVTASKQTTQGGATGGYTTAYAYNLSGALVEQSYPSGRVVKNILDDNGDLAAVQSKKNANQAHWNYANHFSYNAAGAVTSMQLGNGTWQSTTFNSRLQPTQIALGKTQNATNLLDLDYTYGTTDNNGNVMSQTINVPNVGATDGFTAVQTYNYDSLNRLKDATENITPHGGSQVQSWKQTFTFDRYGNRRFDFANGNTTMPESNCTEAI